MTNGVGYHFYSGHFREGVCFMWWCVFWWVLSKGVFLGCFFKVFRIYTTPFVCILSFTGLCWSWAGT